MDCFSRYIAIQMWFACARALPCISNGHKSVHAALQELLDHLEGMLSNEAVVVTVGQAIVEVKPQVGVTTFMHSHMARFFTGEVHVGFPGHAHPVCFICMLLLSLS